MAFASGQRISSARLNRIQPVTYDVAATSALTLSTTETDITGALITLTTSAANAIYVASAVFDMEATTAAAAVMQGRLSVDGSTQTEEALLDGSYSSDARVTSAQLWRGTLASAGSHTFQLRGLKTAAVGVMRINNIHTTLTVTILEVV